MLYICWVLSLLRVLAPIFASPLCFEQLQCGLGCRGVHVLSQDVIGNVQLVLFSSCLNLIYCCVNYH